MQIVPPEGAPLGSAEKSLGSAPQPSTIIQAIPIARFRGISPKVAVVWPGQHNVVFVRHGLDPYEAITSLSRSLACDSVAAPIHLFGPWADTDVSYRPVPHSTYSAPEIRNSYPNGDPIAPYDVNVLVQRSSDPRYENAFLMVQVPRELGRPLTGYDLAAQQRGGATIDIVARCEGTRFVAQSVKRNLTHTSSLVAYHGHVYRGLLRGYAPRNGPELGSAELRYRTAGASPMPISVSRVRGISPRRALAWPERPNIVFVRRGIRLPEEVAGLLHTPHCQGDPPIRMLGSSYGAISAGGPGGFSFGH